MKNLTRSLLLGFIFALIYLPLLHAQTAESGGADSKSTTANPSVTGQAPDEVMKKLTDLVHAGKYAEAQQLTAGLLLAYPDDQRLVKAKALLDKSPAAAGTANAAPSSNPQANDAASTSPVASMSARQFTGMDKVEYNTLIELAREAQQGTGLEQQKASLNQFMDKSRPFLQKHPDQMLLWQLRAASAISLNDPMAAYEAGQKLIATGAADSNDPNLQRLLAQLNSKGWLDEQKAEDDKKYGGLLGTWKVSWSVGTEPNQSGSNEKEAFVKSAMGKIEGYYISPEGSKQTQPNMRGIINASGDISWEMYLRAISAKNGKSLDPDDPGGSYFTVNDAPGKPLYPSGWQPPIFYVLSDDKRTMTMRWPQQSPNPKRDSRFVLAHPVTWTFEKLSDSQSQ
jgi:hypothetical protein